MTTNGGTPLTLEGIKVIDAATLFAGPVIATMLGDYGADVIKVEHPRGDNLRTLGWNEGRRLAVVGARRAQQALR